MNERYGKRAKSGSPLKNLPLLLLVLVLVIGGALAARRMGLLPSSGGSADASAVVEEPVTDAGPEAEDASVSHAPIASIIGPTLTDDENPKPEQTAAQADSSPVGTANITPALPGEGITVCIDPGHGGKDPGCNTEKRLEKDDVLKLGLAMRTAMEAQGITVVMTREDDTFIPLDQRCEIANNAGATYYISIHRNIYESSEVYGNEVWKSSNASEEASTLADNVMSGLVSAGIQKDRGVREGSQDGHGDYLVLRNTSMPSVLLEMGFVQNKKDNKYFDENIDAYAEAITKAVLDTWEEYHVDMSDAVVNLDGAES